MEQTLEVVSQRHQRPFSPHFFETTQAEPPESQGPFDDSENRFNGLFALRGELPSLFGLDNGVKKRTPQNRGVVRRNR